jgi:hypothetical protein
MKWASGAFFLDGAEGKKSIFANRRLATPGVKP